MHKTLHSVVPRECSEVTSATTLHPKPWRCEDMFQRSIYYNYHFGAWVGVPFLSDMRLLAFNSTTFRDLGLDLPPPHGAWPSSRDVFM